MTKAFFWGATISLAGLCFALSFAPRVSARCRQTTLCSTPACSPVCLPSAICETAPIFVEPAPSTVCPIPCNPVPCAPTCDDPLCQELKKCRGDLATAFSNIAKLQQDNRLLQCRIAAIQTGEWLSGFVWLPWLLLIAGTVAGCCWAVRRRRCEPAPACDIDDCDTDRREEDQQRIDMLTENLRMTECRVDQLRQDLATARARQEYLNSTLGFRQPGEPAPRFRRSRTVA